MRKAGESSKKEGMNGIWDKFCGCFISYDEMPADFGGIDSSRMEYMKQVYALSSPFALFDLTATPTARAGQWTRKSPTSAPKRSATRAPAAARSKGSRRAF